jgi:hypothetical protein
VSKHRVRRSAQDNHEYIMKRKTEGSFELSWRTELVESKDSGDRERVQLSELFSYAEERCVVCLSCAEAKVRFDFAEGKMWNLWKTDYLKRYHNQNIHLDIQIRIQ